MVNKQKFYRNEFVVTSFSHSKKISDSCTRLYSGNVTIRYKEHYGDGIDGHEKILSSKNRTFKVFELNRGIVKIDGCLAGECGCWEHSDTYLEWGYCPVCRNVNSPENSAGQKTGRAKK
ncbi:MAG: hypothetical protein WC976_06770 [Caldisericia bacterium]